MSAGGAVDTTLHEHEAHSVSIFNFFFFLFLSMNNCACNRCVSVFVSVSFKCAWFESWDVPRVTLAKVRVNQTKLVSFKLRERAYSHTLTRTYTTYIKKAKPNGKTRNYRSRLVANQLPLWSCVYCYIVHSSLWPNARVLTKSILFAVWRLFILHSLTFYFERSLFVVRSLFLLDYFEKSEMNCLCLYGICSPHVKNGLLLLLAFYISLLFISSVHNAKCLVV